MYIKLLRIRNTVTNIVMREVPFHMGANFVVDTEDSKRHNKVGKTTFLKLIDVLMGAQNKKLVYIDPETNTETIELRDIIIEKRVAVEMTVTQSLETPYGRTWELKVELFPRGGYFIDGTRMPLDSYRKKLNEIFFGIENNVPTFRQLINSFVRVSVGGDDTSFLRTLPRTSNAVYRSVYNHLFAISDPTLDNQLSKLKTMLGHAQESLRQYERVNGVDDIEEQRQVLVALEGEYGRIKRQVDDIFDSEEYKANRDSIAAVRSEYTRLTDALSEIDYRISRNESTLASARDERKRQADLDVSRKFFDEVCAMLPDLNKTFEEMVDFNVKLVENKIAYFESIVENLQLEREKLADERSSLVESNSQYLSLVAHDRIEEYERLSESLMQLQQEIGRRKEIVSTLERYDQELSAIQAEIDSYSTGGSKRGSEGEGYQVRMNSFNGFFTSLAFKINGERPILVYSPDTNKFPMSITELSGTSTGTRKSLIAAFDLAYQQFAASNHILTPRFIVHDVIENVEGDDLRVIIEAANSLNAQYIVAILKEKLDSSHISQSEQAALRIIQLAEEDKLFEGKFVDEAEGAI